MRRFLISGLLITTLFCLAGCSLAGQENIDEPAPSVIPFLIKTPNYLDPLEHEVWLGWWDLDKGRISFDDTPLLKVEGGPCDLHWETVYGLLETECYQEARQHIRKTYAVTSTPPWN